MRLCRSSRIVFESLRSAIVVHVAARAMLDAGARPAISTTLRRRRRVSAEALCEGGHIGAHGGAILGFGWHSHLRSLRSFAVQARR